MAAPYREIVWEELAFVSGLSRRDTRREFGGQSFSVAGEKS
jgi:hypothetical protein